MMNKNINWLNEIDISIKQTRKPKVVSPFDAHRNEIMALKKCGLSWEQTAGQVNRIFDLKGQNRMNARSLARVAKKWEGLNWIDLVKVGAIVEEYKKNTSKDEIQEIPNEIDNLKSVVSPPVGKTEGATATTSFNQSNSFGVPSSSKPNYKSIEWQNGIYTSKDEFITEVKENSDPRYSFNQSIADTVWSVNPGKSRKVIMNSYTTRVVDASKK